MKFLTYIDVEMPHLATCRRDYAGLIFELTLTLTVRVRVSSNSKPSVYM